MRLLTEEEYAESTKNLDTAEIGAALGFSKQKMMSKSPQLAPARMN